MNQSKRFGTNAKTVRITLANGKTTSIDPNDIPTNAWNDHHGTASDGTTVRSFQTYTSPNGAFGLIRNSDDPDNVIGGSAQAIEVLVKSLSDVNGSIGLSNSASRS